MKRICCLSVMLLLMATMMNAQWRITPEAGMNISKVEGSKAGVGAKVGVGIRYSFKGDDTGWGIRSGLHYVQRTSHSSWGEAYFGKSAEGLEFTTFFVPGGPTSFLWDNKQAEKVRFSKNSLRMDYLELPVLAQYTWEIAPDIRWHVAAGPYVAVGITGKDKTSYTDWDLKDKFEPGEVDFNPFNYKKRFDAGAVAQTGIEVKNIAFLLTYEIPLYKRSSRGNSHEISIGLGYTF